MQAKVYGVPGERSRTVGTLRVVLPVLAALFFTGGVAGVGAGMLFAKILPVVFLCLAVVAGVFLLWTAHLCPGRIEAFFKGARGEERTAFALENLPEGFCVFHGLARGKGLAGLARGDMDHVVAGRTGVFVVETKCWEGEVTCDRGRIWVEGRLPSRDPLAQVSKARDELESALAGKDHAVKVRAVLCFAGRGFTGERANINGVEVCHVREVAGLIEKSDEAALTREEVGTIADKLVKML